MFLGMDPIDKLEDVWWTDLNDTTKDHAKVLGYTKDKWDDDWEIDDLPVDKKNWKDLTKDETKAAKHFGWSEQSWNGTYQAETFSKVRTKNGQ